MSEVKFILGIIIAGITFFAWYQYPYLVLTIWIFIIGIVMFFKFWNIKAYIKTLEEEKKPEKERLIVVGTRHSDNIVFDQIKNESPSFRYPIRYFPSAAEAIKEIDRMKKK